MKNIILKFFVFLLTASVMLGATVCIAGQDDENVKNAELTKVLEPETYVELAYGLRGFTVSPDGKRLFLGYLHGQYGDASHISVHDAETFEKITEIIPVVDEGIPVGKGNYYPKGLAVDSRGFLYVGVTHAETQYCSIYCYDNYYQEIGHTVEELDDVTGINGIAVHKEGDKILLYVLTCYNVDTLRCYDVTDPTDMKLYGAFGNGGVVDFKSLSGSSKDAGYIAVDTEGSVYVTCLKKDNGLRKGSHVLKLSRDGKTVEAEAAVDEAYGICFAGDYLFVSTYGDEKSCVYALNRSDLSEVAKYRRTEQEYPLTGIAYGGDYLYVADQGDEMMDDAGRVLRTKEKLILTRDPAETEKTDPGKYEVPPTEVPTEAPGENGDETGGRKIGPALIIASAAILLVAGAAAAFIAFRKKKAG